MPSPSSISGILDKLALYEQLPATPIARAVLAEGASTEEIDQAEHLLEELLASCGGESENWRRVLIEDAKHHKEKWARLINRAEAARALEAEASEEILANGIEIEHCEDLEKLVSTLTEIVASLANKRQISPLATALRKPWRAAVQQIRVNSREPKTETHFRAALSSAKLSFDRQRLQKHWNGLAVRVGLPQLTETGQPELVVSRFIPAISQCLDWSEHTYVPYVASVERLGIGLNSARAAVPKDVAGQGEVAATEWAAREIVRPALNEVRRRTLLRLAQEELSSSRDRLEGLAESYKSPLLYGLLESITLRDAVAYRQTFMELTSLIRKRDLVFRRRELLEKLVAPAPGWHSALARRDGIHGLASPPGDLGLAWRWKLLLTRLDRIGSQNLSALQRAVETAMQRLEICTGDLATAMAWRRQHDRYDLPTEQALGAFATAIKKMGSGTGKRVPSLIQVARRCMAQGRNAVPVWIMPL